MASANKTQYAILGMLSFRPQSGYDIKKAIDQSIHFFWHENYGHIYPILKRLEEKGLVRKQHEKPKNSRVRNVFALTGAGRRELKAWLAEPPAPPPVRNELLLKLFFGRQTNPRGVAAMLAAEKKRNAALLARFKQIEKTISQIDSPDAPYWLATLRFGMGVTGMVQEWCGRTLKNFPRRKT